jgi:hypothetical protein
VCPVIVAISASVHSAIGLISKRIGCVQRLPHGERRIGS